MMKEKKKWAVGVFLCVLAMPTISNAMHIMEGFLPKEWCIAWGAIVIPFIVVGLSKIKKIITEHPKLKVLLSMVGAFAFVLSALKIPSVTGSCSHPTGVGLGAILFGPTVMTVIGVIVLLFQAILLAHGGLTTLGANSFSMGVVGPFVSYGVFKLLKKSNAPVWAQVFFATFLGNLLTYITTSIQLAMAFPSEIGGFGASLAKFMGIFAVTQIPLAISEGILSVIVFNAINAYANDELKELKVLREV